MKKNPSVSHADKIAKLHGKFKTLEGIKQFTRKGEVGGWKEDITPQLEEKINEYTREKLADTDYMLSF